MIKNSVNTGFPFLSDKDLLIQFATKECSLDNPWMKDLIGDFDSISDSEKKEMYLAYFQNSEYNTIISRNERNIIRFKMKNESKRRLESSNKRYRSNKLKIEKSNKLHKWKTIIIKYSLITALYLSLILIGKYFL